MSRSPFIVLLSSPFMSLFAIEFAEWWKEQKPVVLWHFYYRLSSPTPPDSSIHLKDKKSVHSWGLCEAAK